MNRHLLATVAIGVTVAAGIAAVALDRIDVALVLMLVLLGGVAILVLEALRRTSRAAQRAGQDVTRLRREIRDAAARAGSTADHERTRRHIARVHGTISSAHTETMDALEDSASIVADATSTLREVRSGIGALRRQVRAAEPRHLLTEVQALDQLRTRFPTTSPLPELGGWALDPTGLVWLVDEISRKQPAHVVECGSGTSTFWIAMALRENGHGRVVAMEHLEEYVRRTTAVLERHGLAEWAEVRHAPLTEHETPRGIFPWYDVDPTTLGAIDLLVVDGPPQSTGHLARYPALPLLRNAMAPGAWVLVDDMQREDEQQAVEYWLEEFPDLRQVGPTNDNSVVLCRD